MFQSLFSLFAASPDCIKDGLFGIPRWYQYLDVQRNTFSNACELSVKFSKPDGSIDFTTISLIGLGVIDILLRVGVLIAVGFIIYGGIQYVTSQGEPDRVKQAGSTLTNAVIGLVITILAASIVRFIGNRIGA